MSSNSSESQQKGGCPFNKSGDKTVTPVVLASHLATLNIVIGVLCYLDQSLLRLSLNFLMLSLLACLVVVQGKKILGLPSKKESTGESASCPSSVPCCSFDLSNQESIVHLYQTLYVKLNDAIQTFRKIVLLQDKILTAKVIVGLYVVSRFVKCIGDFGSIAIAANIACAAPYVIQNHSEQINAVLAVAEQQASAILGPLLAKAGIKQKTA